MNIVDDFIESEKAKMSWWDKVLSNYPDVRTTHYHSTPGVKSKFGDEKLLRPSAILRVQALFILFFMSMAWMLTLREVLHVTTPMSIFLLAFLFFTSIIIITIRNYFFRKKYNYTIRITPVGISIDEVKFHWNEIAETCIMSRQEGKMTNHYLILFGKDGSVHKYDLWMFGVSTAKLATIIETFKMGGR